MVAHARDVPLGVEFDRLDFDPGVDVDPHIAAGRGDRSRGMAAIPPDVSGYQTPSRMIVQGMIAKLAGAFWGSEARVGGEAVEQLADRGRLELLVDLAWPYPLAGEMSAAETIKGDSITWPQFSSSRSQNEWAISLANRSIFSRNLSSVRAVGRVDGGEGVAEPGGVDWGCRASGRPSEHDPERRVEAAELEVTVRGRARRPRTTPVDPGMTRMLGPSSQR